MSDIVERLRIPLDGEETMRRWDWWRKMHKEGYGGSSTREEFESVLGHADEEREEAADEIERLRGDMANSTAFRDAVALACDDRMTADKHALRQAHAEIARLNKLLAEIYDVVKGK